MSERITFKVLYIEDDDGLARLFQKRMSRHGYQAEIAQTGKAGLQMLAHHKFDVIIIDYQLPGLSGLEILETLGKKTDEIPVIMLTGAGNEEIAVQAMKSGATDYLTKDVDGNYFELLPLVMSDAIDRFRLKAEHKRMQKDLQEYAVKLARSNRELQQFAYVVSHDLKEPLQTIRGFVSLLEESLDGALNGESSEYIEYIIAGTRRMERLIEGLLAYSRVKFHKMKVTQVNVGEIVKQVKQDLYAISHNKHAEIICDPMPVIRGNERLLLRLFQNLLDNALKYCRNRPPSVHIAVSETDDEWHFNIKDNGIGIDAKNLERIFEIFQRAHPAKEFVGDGLGLAICKTIVENHHGKIWVESKVDQGSTFFFTISKHL